MLSFFSKLIGVIVNPLVAVFILMCLSFVCAVFSYSRTSLLFLILAVCSFGVSMFTPFGNLLMLPLEERFVRPKLPENIDGIIVLGGGLEFRIAHDRNVVEQANAADRLYETTLLAKKFPNAKVVYTGSTVTIGEKQYPSGEIAKKYLVNLGIDSKRIILENASRNTFDNVVFSKALLNPAKIEKWVVVTSAYHMPRAIGVFRAQSWHVIPWVSDYQTHGPDAASDFSYSVSSNISTLDLAIHEWVGLAAYYYAGRTSEFLPSPAQ